MAILFTSLRGAYKAPPNVKKVVHYVYNHLHSLLCVNPLVFYWRFIRSSDLYMIRSGYVLIAITQIGS